MSTNHKKKLDGIKHAHTFFLFAIFSEKNYKGLKLHKKRKKTSRYFTYCIKCVPHESWEEGAEVKYNILHVLTGIAHIQIICI